MPALSQNPMFQNLPLKLVVTPVLITGATLVGRRWGDAMSGWLVGLPLTSGPVVFFLALDQGNRFAAVAALGVLLGVTSQAVFGLAYVWLGGKRSWTVGVAAGTAFFGLATVLFDVLRLPPVVEPVLVAISLVIAIALMPRNVIRISEAGKAEPADIPLRIAIATGLVVGLTAVAPALGPRLSGLLSPFPLYAAILAVFAHRRDGIDSAAAVWRGLMFGLFAFAAFFSVLGATLGSLGIGGAFLLAVVVALVIQAAALVALRPRVKGTK